MQPRSNKRVFDTENALKGTFNGWWGKWQTITYVCFVLSYAIIIGWINELPNYTMVLPKGINFTNFEKQRPILSNATTTTATTSESSTLLNLTDVVTESNDGDNNNNNNEARDLLQTMLNNSKVGSTVPLDFGILSPQHPHFKLSRYIFSIGFILGAIVLGFGSDRGGRKIIILACIWTTGIMSVFQLVGTDYMSYIFFQFFVGLFLGGIQAAFLPAIVEMFPIKMRTLYGVGFHFVVCLFQVSLPWLAKSFRNWKLLQGFVTAPLILTACLQWFVYESIFWFLAHKEYDKAIKSLTTLAKRNGILFESKFKQAKDFLHAKHSKATQVDILPLLRLQDLDFIGKKYPQIDMVELQKNKENGSKLRVFLNSLKGSNYKSTNTVYNPFDFVYSPTMLVYVLILLGLWLTNGLTDSMLVIRHQDSDDIFYDNFLNVLSCLLSSGLAIFLAIFKLGRKHIIFFAYLFIDICFLGSLITKYANKDQDDHTTKVSLVFIFHTTMFASKLGLIFLMLSTCELFPTSMRCTGLGLGFSFKVLGSLIASPDTLGYNSEMHRLSYCVLTLFFGSLALFLPETRKFPLPRSILQIEAMPTTLGKLLRSKKVKLACENSNQPARDSTNKNANTTTLDSKTMKEGIPLINMNSLAASQADNKQSLSRQSSNKTDASRNKISTGDGTHVESLSLSKKTDSNYDTMTSLNDIEQDDFKNYYDETGESASASALLNVLKKKREMSSLAVSNNNDSRALSKILEVPSKNITRNNSFTDVDMASGADSKK